METIVRNKLAIGALAAAAGLMGAARGDAATTSINPPIYGGEKTHQEIISHIYGESFVANGNDFEGGGLVIKRLDDATDQVWTGASFSAKVHARFATLKQAFGYFDGASGGSFTKIFDVFGLGYNVEGEASDIDLTGHEIRFGRNGQKGTNSSLDSENPDGLDHLVTYEVQNLNDGKSTWLLFWEDLSGKGSDYDHNDLVVEVSAVNAAPLPLAAWTGLATLAGGGIVHRMRRRR